MSHMFRIYGLKFVKSKKKFSFVSNIFIKNVLGKFVEKKKKKLLSVAKE